MNEMYEVKLPCKPGQILYTIEWDSDCERLCVHKAVCSSIEIEEDCISIYLKSVDGSYDTYAPDDFGEEVFISRSEALYAIEKGAI